MHSYLSNLDSSPTVTHVSFVVSGRLSYQNWCPAPEMSYFVCRYVQSIVVLFSTSSGISRTVLQSVVTVRLMQ